MQTFLVMELYTQKQALLLTTAAHKQLSFGTIVKVTNLTNNKSVLVKVNDRGPFAAGRIIDLSKSAAASIDMITTGIVKVTIQYRKEKKPLLIKKAAFYQ